MHKTFVLTTVLLISAASAMAAQPVVPLATLQGMGLGQMRSMSDNDGLAVRGKGTSASVWGSSQANWAGQSSSNNYSASASWQGKPSGATGNSYSFAGKFQGFGRIGR